MLKGMWGDAMAGSTRTEAATRRPGSMRLVAWIATALALLGCLEAVLLAVAREQWSAVGGPGPAALDEVVVAVVTAAAAALTAWLGACGLAALLGHLPGQVGRLARAWADAWAPAAVRRVAAVVVGAAVGGVLAPGSAAGSAPPPAPGFAATAIESVMPPAPGFAVTTPRRESLSGLPGQAAARDPEAAAGLSGADPSGPGWTPTRPLERRQVSPRLVAGAAPRPGPAPVVVLRGDSLWSIAARHLGPDATDAEVATEWPRWYAANRGLIGDDPDVLLPGQVLRSPAPPEAVAR